MNVTITSETEGHHEYETNKPCSPTADLRSATVTAAFQTRPGSPTARRPSTRATATISRRVVPANGSDTSMQFGIHRAVGGFPRLPESGRSPLRRIGCLLRFDIADARRPSRHSPGVPGSKVDAECDVRGCLLVEPTVPVGFQRMHCRVRLQPEDHVKEEAIQMLVAAAEKSCVVLQTLRNGVTVQTRIEADS